jgi:hypothetical protein
LISRELAIARMSELSPEKVFAEAKQRRAELTKAVGKPIKRWQGTGTQCLVEDADGNLYELVQVKKLPRPSTRERLDTVKRTLEALEPVFSRTGDPTALLSAISICELCLEGPYGFPTWFFDALRALVRNQIDRTKTGRTSTLRKQLEARCEDYERYRLIEILRFREKRRLSNNETFRLAAALRSKDTGNHVSAAAIRQSYRRVKRAGITFFNVGRQLSVFASDDVRRGNDRFVNASVADDDLGSPPPRELTSVN